MNIRQMLAGFALSMLAAGPQVVPVAMAAEPEEGQVQQQAEDYNAKQEDPEQKVICKREEVTGTRFKQTVCRTVAETKYDQENAKRWLDRKKAMPTKNF